MSATAHISVPFTDDVEADLGYWLADAPWATTTDDFNSASTSWTDSPAAYYANNLNVSLTLASPIDLTSASAPHLKFWHHYRLESGFDFAFVEVATSSSAGPWSSLAAYSGSGSSPYTGPWPSTSAKSDSGLVPFPDAFLSTPGEPWTLEQISLAGYAGAPAVWVRFRLNTDSTVVDDGWYIDDIGIDETSTAVSLSSVVTSTNSTIDLSWTVNADANFASYKVFRSDKAGVTFNDTLVANISDQASTTVTDTSLPPKSRFYYKVFVVSASGVYSGSNEVSGTTLAGLDYPFFDNMETSGGNWNPQPSTAWTRVTVGDAHSGGNVWTDSPGSSYTNNIDVSLILSDEIFLNPASQLVFWHKLAVMSGDTAEVEVSTDGGTTWTQLTSYTNTTISSWTRVQVNLGQTTTSALIRFRLVTDLSGVADGWTIDDASISDLPDAVTLSAPIPQVSPNFDQILLSWSTSTEVSFAAYEIYRSTLAGVTDASTLIATITDPSTTSYTDSGLTAETTYYYRVYVLNDFGLRNGSNEASATTNQVVPDSYFFDDMESGTTGWTWTGTWAHTTAVAHSTSTSWTDSPDVNYANSSDTYLQTSVDLTGALMPMLEFWHRYSIEENLDFGYVEVSTDGTSWDRVYFVTGAQSTWISEKVDLTEYAGSSNVRIKFRLTTNSTVPSGGWFVDDVLVIEAVPLSLDYPLFDDFDTSTSDANWITGSWDTVSPGRDLSAGMLSDSPVGNYARDIDTSNGYLGRVILASTLDLSGATHPQLTFWHRYFFYLDTVSWLENKEYDTGRVYVSNFYGRSGTWQQVASFTGTQSLWTQVQLDLSDYAGFSNVRIMFVMDDDWAFNSCCTYYFRQADGWYIDDVSIKEAPTDVKLNLPANVTMHSADLSWSQNNDTDFNRYEIYRAKNVDPTRSDTLVAYITDQNQTTFTDSYTILQPDRFRYRLYVVDNLGRYSLGSAAVVAVYTVPLVGFPFVDNMEGGTASWEWSSPWGQVTTTAHSTTTSWADSPLGSYDDSVDTSLTTFISLIEADSPVLTFWHRLQLVQAEDYGYVEVSPDGGANWDELLRVTGTEDWNQERIDLNTYRGMVVGLRFRLGIERYQRWRRLVHRRRERR